MGNDAGDPTVAVSPRLTRAVAFQCTDDARHPYAALVDGERWVVRVNEFPEAPSVFSLLVDGVVVEELLRWPPAWRRPDADGG